MCRQKTADCNKNKPGGRRFINQQQRRLADTDATASAANLAANRTRIYSHSRVHVRPPHFKTRSALLYNPTIARVGLGNFKVQVVWFGQVVRPKVDKT